jgi:hypothetical protein
MAAIKVSQSHHHQQQQQQQRKQCDQKRFGFTTQNHPTFGLAEKKYHPKIINF